MFGYDVLCMLLSLLMFYVFGCCLSVGVWGVCYAKNELITNALILLPHVLKTDSEIFVEMCF